MTEGLGLRVSAALAAAALLVLPAAAQQDREPPVLTLRQAIALAVAHAPETAAAQANEAEALAAVSGTGTPFGPRLWLDSSPAYAGGLPGTFGRLPSLGGAHAGETLYDPARRIEGEQARGGLGAARAERALAASRIAEETAALFARCRSGKAVIAAAEAKLRARQAVAMRGQELRREGRATDLDSRRAELHVAQARQELARSRSDHELDELALRGRLGLPADAPLILEGEPALPEADASPADDWSVARSADPRLRALAEQIGAEERATRIRGQWFAPVIELGADYSRLYKTTDWDDFYRSFKRDQWSLGASLKVPLFAGNARSVEAARGQARLDRLRAERAARERDLELELRRVQASLVAAHEALEVAQLAQALADEDLRVSSALLAEGRVDAVDRAEKEQAVAEAARDLALARADLMLAEMKRLSLRGQLVE